MLLKCHIILMKDSERDGATVKAYLNEENSHNEKGTLRPRVDVELHP